MPLVKPEAFLRAVRGRASPGKHARTGMVRRRLLLSVLGLFLLFMVMGAAPVQAQPVLVDASPPPDTTLSESPSSVTLTFDRALSDTGTWITVSGEGGERFDREDGHVDPTNRFILTATLEPLPEGRYTVVYHAASPGNSTIAAGQYQFVVDLPDPSLEMLSPVSGQAFDGPVIPVEVQVHHFDFGLYDNRVRVYVDGKLYTELRDTTGLIEGLAPGVHEIKTMLARFEDEELPDTASVAYIAVAQPDAEAEGRILAAAAPPDPGLRLAPHQWAGVAVLALALLGAGVWLGRSTDRSGTDS